MNSGLFEKTVKSNLQLSEMKFLLAPARFAGEDQIINYYFDRY